MKKFFYQNRGKNSLLLIVVYITFLVIYTTHTHNFNFNLVQSSLVQGSLFQNSIPTLSEQNSESKDPFLDNFGNCLIQQFSQSLINLDYIPPQLLLLKLKEEISKQNHIEIIFLLTNEITPRAPPIV